MRSDDVVAHALAHHVYQTALAQHRQEIGMASQRVDEAYYRHRYQRDILEIRYHVEYPDQYAHGYGQRHADYRETDAIEHARAERHDSLASEIMVQAQFHVVDHHERAVAVFARKYQLEPTHYLRIVYQYEKDVDERQQPSDRGDEDVDRLRQQRSPLGDYLVDVHVLERRRYFLWIDVSLHELDDLQIIGRHGLAAGADVPDDRAEHVYVAYHGGQEEIDQSADDYRHFEHGHDRRHHTPVGVGDALVEDHDGLQQIGKETGHEKGQQNVAQIPDEPYQGRGYGEPDYEPHHAVEIPVSICHFTVD